jgi:hypothetical protein
VDPGPQSEAQRRFLAGGGPHLRDLLHQIEDRMDGAPGIVLVSLRVAEADQEV